MSRNFAEVILEGFPFLSQLLKDQPDPLDYIADQTEIFLRKVFKGNQIRCMELRNKIQISKGELAKIRLQISQSTSSEQEKEILASSNYHKRMTLTAQMLSDLAILEEADSENPEVRIFDELDVDENFICQFVPLEDYEANWEKYINFSICQLLSVKCSLVLEFLASRARRS